MKFVTVHRTKMSGAALAVAVAMSALLSPAVSAQGVYRVVGPDGKVTYSDQPPPANANARPVGGASAAAGNSSALPSELRQAAGRYPVTLYAGADCAPCDSGRNFLNARGIPFSEKTVSSADDIAAFKRLNGVASLPMLAVGGQHLKGYSESEWTQYLDAAGYPKTSALPAGYRRSAATPLVEAKSAAAPATTAQKVQEPKAPVEIPVTAPATNPSGIKF
jgi:glutaredoxin